MEATFNFRSFVTKNYNNVFILMSIAILSFGACKSDSQIITKAQMKAIVEKQNELLGNCFINGNADMLSEMYSDSAKLSPNGYHFIVGRDSIKAFWQDDFKTSKVLKMETQVLTINGNENLIYETGYAISEILYNDSVYHARVKYINVWQKQLNGDYKLDVDFWNKDEQ